MSLIAWLVAVYKRLQFIYFKMYISGYSIFLIPIFRFFVSLFFLTKEAKLQCNKEKHTDFPKRSCTRDDNALACMCNSVSRYDCQHAPKLSS